MIEVSTPIWEASTDPKVNAICILTNGYIDIHGLAALNSDSAIEYAKRVPNAAKNIGHNIREAGNRPSVVSVDETTGIMAVTFPTKPVGEYRDGKWVTGKSPELSHDARVICNSAMELKGLAKLHSWTKVVIPCPVPIDEWPALKPRLEGILDSEVFTVSV